MTGKTGTVTVGTDGTVTIPNLAVNRTYELTETKAPTGYVLDKTVHKVTLTTAQANKVVTVIIENTAQKAPSKLLNKTKKAKTFNRRRISVEGYSDRKNRNSDSWNRRNGHNSNLAVNRTYELTETKHPQVMY